MNLLLKEFEHLNQFIKHIEIQIATEINFKISSLMIPIIAICIWYIV